MNQKCVFLVLFGHLNTKKYSYSSDLNAVASVPDVIFLLLTPMEDPHSHLLIHIIYSFFLFPQEMCLFLLFLKVLKHFSHIMHE